MLKAFKYRLYPTIAQAELINKHIGSARFVYNLALETKMVAFSGTAKNLTRYDLQKQLPDLKDACPWLKEINAQSLQVALLNLDAAYTRFYKGQSAFPVFKKNMGAQGFGVPQSVKIKNSKICFRKFSKGILAVIHRPTEGLIKQAVITRTPAGKYFASILCETGENTPVKKPIKAKSTIGIDLGIKTYLVTSEGAEIENPKVLRRVQAKLKFIQRKYAKHKGRRTRKRLSALHETVNNKRSDFLHKLSTKLIRENQSIAVEDLHVKGMVKNHKLAQSVSDASWGAFIAMLEYKANWYGKNILKIGRFEPSSKTCSNCWAINKELTLKHREWVCAGCGSVHDRDRNAAINIKNFALKNLSVERRLKNQNELPAIVGVLTSETNQTEGGSHYGYGKLPSPL